MADKVSLKCAIDPENVSFLLGPRDFYDTLCDLYGNATKRIVLASLYVGCGELEEELIRTILRTKERNKDITVDILVDKARTDRVGKGVTLVTPLTILQKYLAPGSRVNVNLFHNPLLGALCGKIFKPPYCEAFGTMHMKVYIGDDRCIITGANTGRDYFCDRCDRYIVMKDPLFCDAMHTFVKLFQTASYTLTEKLTVEWLSDFANPLEDNVLFRKQLCVRAREMVLMCRNILEKQWVNVNGNGYGSSAADFSDYDAWIMSGGNSNNTVDAFNACNGEPINEKCINKEGKHGYYTGEGDENASTHSGGGSNVSCHLNGTVGKSSVTHRYTTPRDAVRNPDKGGKEKEYFYIKICLQMPFSDPPFVQGENLLDEWILRYVKNGYSILIATAYLNFTERFMNVINQAIKIGQGVGKKNPVQVVTASPQANTWFNDVDLKRKIALFYSSSAMWMLQSMKNEKGYPADVYMEYNRPKHTFHAKGVWALKDRVSIDMAHSSEEEFNEATDLPLSMIIGSSNYSRRSVAKDLEVIFFVETNSEKLRKFMRREIYEMVKYSDYVPYSSVRSRVGLGLITGWHVMKEFL
ncbi:CDP-alcohol phosphatidyltransferase class-II family protein [Babesia gibsoni]|uniref:CDP-diacylglycerol--glycerol-3-phosphate 3-phosphatidyltransferase n=1 Tax=Babesia gibsoni TaxID=33632 RepID=A0AAD8LKI6_BABGI|nr:CDP-alcohol phosphatidyltransferase class-II family protein [Babesia gibsoni]